MRQSTFNTALVMDRLAFWLPAALYGFGLAVVGLRLAGLDAARWEWLAAGAAAAGMLAAWILDLTLGRHRWYDAEYALAWLDWRNHAGGRMLAGEAAAMDAARVTPALSLRPLAKKAVLPLLFVVVAHLTPPLPASERVSGEGVVRAVARVEERVRQAEEKKALAKPEPAELLRQLEQVRQLAATNPRAAAEALARLAGRVDEAMAERLRRGLDALEKARSLAGAAAGGDNSAAARDAAWKELQGAWEKMAAGEGGENTLPDELRQALAEASEAVRRQARQTPPQGMGAAAGANTNTASSQTGSPQTGSEKAGEQSGTAANSTTQSGTSTPTPSASNQPGSEAAQSGTQAGQTGQAGQASQAGGELGQSAESGQSAATAGAGQEQMQRLVEALAEYNRGNLSCAVQAGLPAARADMAGRMLAESGEAGSEAGAAGGGALPSASQSLAALQAAMLQAAESGRGGIGKGGSPTPLTFGDETEAAGARFTPTPLPAPDEGVTPGMTLRRDRLRPDAPLPPEEFRDAGRSGAAARGAVVAGEASGPLGPERARAAERYFQQLQR